MEVMDGSGWKWMAVDGSGWKWMDVHFNNIMQSYKCALACG